MKKIAVLIVGLALTFSYVAQAEVSDADKKWLKVVETMVAEGKTKVTTPSQSRADLAKEWAAKSGYTVQVSKTATGFQLDLSKNKELATDH